MRHFRILPLSGAKLALSVGGMFLLPVLLMLAAMGAVQTFFGMHLMTWGGASRALLISAPILLAPGLLLYQGLSWKSYLYVLTPTFILVPVADLLDRYVPVPIRALIWGVALAAGAMLIFRAITRRSETYRSSMNWPARPA